MAIKVKGAADSANRFAQNASAQSAYYATEAKAAGEEWATKTAQAVDTFRQAISSANLELRYKAGVAKAGAAKYTRKVEAVGATRYAPGVNAGKQDYQTNVEPYLATIAGITLDAPAPRGDVRNYQRSQQVGNALHAKRLAMLGVTG
jgi:hypothetical protein